MCFFETKRGVVSVFILKLDNFRQNLLVHGPLQRLLLNEAWDLDLEPVEKLINLWYSPVKSLERKSFQYSVTKERFTGFQIVFHQSIVNPCYLNFELNIQSDYLAMFG